MLSDLCLSILSVLSMTLVYCSKSVKWIKMKLGTQVGLRPGHIVLDGDRATPHQRGWGGSDGNGTEGRVPPSHHTILKHHPLT